MTDEKGVVIPDDDMAVLKWFEEMNHSEMELQQINFQNLYPRN